MAEKTAEGNPRLELIDGLKLIRYYRMAYGKAVSVSEREAIRNQDSKTCPRCGGTPALKTAHKGDYAGQQFWGCSNFPKCRYLENVQAGVAVQ